VCDVAGLFKLCSKCRWIPDQAGAETPPVRNDDGGELAILKVAFRQLIF
jgi:hypothetical protein